MTQRETGQKFALILFDAPVVRDLIGVTRRTGISIGPSSKVDLDPHWTEWLGSIRMKALAASQLMIGVFKPSTTPGILDQESRDAMRDAHFMFMGLLLAKNFITNTTPTLLVGGRWKGGSSIRQVASLPRPVHPPAAWQSSLQQADLEAAADLGERILQVARHKPWRLHRSLTLYRQARCEPDGLERIHQYVRTLEGAVKPPQRGGTTENFVNRMADLAGDGYKDLFRRIYERRNAVAHLREHEILIPPSRATHVELLQDEHISEYLSRSVLARILNDAALCEHFGTADAVDRFWAMVPSERRCIWGMPIDPCCALEGFEPDRYTDAELDL